MSLSRFLKIPLAAITVLAVFVLCMFMFGRTTALASFVINSWQGYKLTSGLILYYSLDGPDINLSAPTAEILDRSGNGFNGDWKNHASTTAIGKIGQGIHFDAVDDFIAVSSSATLAPALWTISAWTYALSAAPSYRPIFHPSYSNGYDGGFLFMVDDGGRAAIRYGNGAGYVGSINSGTTVLNEWHLLTSTFDGTTMSLYVDGVLKNSTNASTYAYYSGSDAIVGVSGGTSYFDGTIDDLRFYNRPLSVDEIKRLYQMGESNRVNVSHRDELTSGLVGYWSFDGRDMDLASSTREVYDRSGNNYHGDWKEHATTTTTGKIGQGIDFDGSNDFVSMGDIAALDMGDTADFSVSGWFWRESSDTADTIIAKRDGFNAADVGYIIDIAATADRLVVELSDGTDEYFFTSGTTFTETSNWGWNHFVVVFDQDSQANTTIYINGRADLYNQTGTIGNVGDLSNSRPVQIGARSDDNAPFNGKLDEIRVYNRVLSADEAKRLYLMGASTKINVSHRDELNDEQLYGYWTFDGRDIRLELPTEEIRDASGSNLHANWKEHATTTTVGKIGQGIWLDGVDDYIGFNLDIDSLDVSDTDSFTIAGWFYRDTQTTADTLIFKRQGIIAAYPGYGAYVTSVSDQLNFEVSDGTDEYSLDSVTTFKNPGWYHFAIVWDPDSAENTEIYINGVDDNAADTGTIANIGDLSNSRVLAIGAQSDGSSPFVGKLDDFRFYKRALSPDEIKRLYLMGE